ncbi:hypothetical protein OG729_02170 [Streptomyces sp. NBC_00210]|uniref:hypothetical protein n=1 Tax=unclassified Streptomyces TaxID=2593676 RepID=UPI003252A021
MGHSSSRRWGVVGVLLAAVAATVAWRTATADRGREHQPDPRTTGSEGRQSPQEVQDYWTPERTKGGRPAPMPEDD